MDTTITESWSEDGLTLTVSAVYSDGEEADVSASWRTREDAEANAAAARTAAEKVLIERRFGFDVVNGRVKRHRARRVGEFFVGIGSGYPFQLKPEVNLDRKIGIRWGRGYISVTTASRVKASK